MTNVRRIGFALVTCAAAAWLGVSFASTNDTGTTQPQWWKGNTHTHTLWSDGNGAPELVTDWYKEHGYNFLVLSDHNILSRGDKWFAVTEGGGRLTPKHIEELEAAFGDDWITERTVGDQRQMRLKPLDELRAHFEVTGSFLLIEGEEITDGFERLPVHMNAVNLSELIPPQHGSTLQETIQRNIDAVREQSERLGIPMLVHINHPNFGWGITPEQVAAVEGETFFEVYNGHSGVRNYGDANHPSTEAMWDIALTLRLTMLDLPILYGMATDDAHDYFNWGVGKTNPGRGWLMVRAEELTSDAIVEAMNRGDFYASSGVTIDEFSTSDDRYQVKIKASPGATYTTQFIGTRMIDGKPGPVGEVLLETTDNPATYACTGDELYVRAKVVSSTLHPNPYAAGDFECAWLQPMLIATPESSPGRDGP